MRGFFQQEIQKQSYTLEEQKGLFEKYKKITGKKGEFKDFIFVLQIFLEHKQAQLQLNALEEEGRIRKQIMDEHLHNCKNVTFPTTIYQVAKKLSRGETLREKQLSQELMYAFVAQMRVETDTKLLKLKLETSKSGDFIQEFRKFLGKKQGVTILSILQESLMLTLFRILMTGEELLEEYALSQEKTMEYLKKSFWQETIHPKQGRFQVLDWFSEEIYPFQVELCPSWKDVYFMQQGCAFVYVAQILTNLIINALNYGNKSSHGRISLHFQEKILENKPYFSIKMENPVDKNSSFLQSTGYGIESVKTSVARLNDTADVNRFTRIEDENGIFILEIFIGKTTLEMEEKG